MERYTTPLIFMIWLKLYVPDQLFTGLLKLSTLIVLTEVLHRLWNYGVKHLTKKLVKK